MANAHSLGPTLSGGEIYRRSGVGLSLAYRPALDTLRSELRTIEPRLIIFDTLAKVMGWRTRTLTAR